MNALAEPRRLTDRFLDEWLTALPADAAAALARWRVSDELEADLNEYFARANEGDLSREQRASYEELLQMRDLVAILRDGAADRAAGRAASPATAAPRPATAAPRTPASAVTAPSVPVPSGAA